MSQTKSLSKSIFTLFILASLSACGGSGGESKSTNSVAHGWQKDVFQDASLFKGQCVSPRPKSVVNPFTNNPYPDKQGTLLGEKLWVRSFNNDVYLWYNEVEDKNPTKYKTAVEYFKALKTTQTTSSGRPKDHFSGALNTVELNKLLQSGVTSGYGAKWVIKTNQTTQKRKLLVLYSEPNSPAINQGLDRGAEVLEVDGVSLANFTTEAQRQTINNGLLPHSIGETHTFKIVDAGASSTRTISMTSKVVEIYPVHKTSIINDTSGRKIGYLLFNTFISRAANPLIQEFTKFKQNNISDLILDLRYNGGGAVSIATLLGSLISGENTTHNKYFMKSVMNDKHQRFDPFSGKEIKPRYFYTTNSDGSDLPRLGLRRVFVLTSEHTCSSSELVMNGLRGVGIEVIQIGATTCGKPYGFVPVDNCSVSYLAINFKGSNYKGFGDYSDGFTPSNGQGNSDIGVRLTGCVAPDDLTQPLGDPAEERIYAALHYRATGNCLNYDSSELNYKKSVISEEIIESKWLKNAIMMPDDHKFQ